MVKGQSNSRTYSSLSTIGFKVKVIDEHIQFKILLVGNLDISTKVMKSKPAIQC